MNASQRVSTGFDLPRPGLATSPGSKFVALVGYENWTPACAGEGQFEVKQ